MLKFQQWIILGLLSLPKISQKFKNSFYYMLGATSDSQLAAAPYAECNRSTKPPRLVNVQL